MPSETFYCPHCKHRLTKSDQAYVMGEIMANHDSNYLGLGDGGGETVTCPFCQYPINSQKMMLGEYDADPHAGVGAGCGITLVAVFAFCVVVFFFGQPWWGGALAALVTMGIVGAIHKSRQKEK